MEKDSFLHTHHPVDKFLACSSILKNYQHYVFPGLNVATEHLLEDEISPEVATEIYKTPLLNISRPLPCLPCKYVEEQDNPREDKIMQLVRKKYYWKRKKKNIKVTLNRLTTRPVLYPELLKTVSQKEPISKLPYAVVRMADHLANDPDEYFKGLYHWYYGNVMRKVTIKNDHFLLYASGSGLNELSMTYFEKPRGSDVVPTLNPQVSMSMAESNLIYDIVINDSVGTIGVRQRNACSFLNYFEDNDGSISFKNFLAVKSSEYPFVALDNCSTEFCTINANRTVQFWSPDYITHCTDLITLPVSDTKLADRFAQIKYDNDKFTQIFTVVDRRNVYVYDKRETHAKASSHLKLDKQVEECEEISLIIPSVREKNWFLGMTHSCVLLDTRMGLVEKWTHMMTQPPSIGHAFRINKDTHLLKETLILSTQTTNEVVAIHRTESEPWTTYSPVRVPNRQDTLHEAHLDGVLTNIHLQHKFRHGIIGLMSYKIKKRMGILSLVSTGDIFHQSVNPSMGVFNKNAQNLSDTELEFLEQWEDEFRSKNIGQKRDLPVTRIVDFSELVNSIDENVEVPSWRPRANPGNQHWKIPIKSLRTYRDLLTPYILNEYGVDDLEDSFDECQNDFTDNAEKVDNWLYENYGQYCNDAQIFEDKAEVFAEEGSEDAPASDPAVELDVEVPPEFDVEELSKLMIKRRRR